LIEDAAQAHGADWNGLRAGSVGDAAAFSFFPGKNLGALGDAGAATTNSTSLAERMRLLRDHGRETKDRHSELGTNARLDTLQAALLSVKLRRLEAWNQDRRRHAAAYDAAFSELDSIEPIRILPQARAVFHQYVLRVAERDRVREGLSEAGIATGIHYPIPLSRQPALAGLADPDAFPNADLLAGSCLSLPMFPELSDGQRERVVAELAAQSEACARAAAGGMAA
jgi:dTDP-4-amino-4,6-dideoxygalactose transaminase